MFRFRLKKLYKSKRIPLFTYSFIKKVNRVLSNENISVRPHDHLGSPGGLIYLNKNIRTLLIPDIHGRIDFLFNILNHKLDERSVLESLILEEIQLVCVGDIFHSELRCKDRWLLAEEEFKNSFKTHKNMDEEMLENLKVLKAVFLLKINFPSNFHLLKGNHENITNEDTMGNRSFRKFANEGEMVKSYMFKFFSKNVVKAIYDFEHSLPILAVGNSFLVSHSEPRNYHCRSNIINYKNSDDTVFDFTWTADDEANEGSVEKMLRSYLPDNYEEALYFSGHRPIAGRYNLRANGKLVQFHNPSKQPVIMLEPGKEFNFDKDLFFLDNEKE